MVSFWDELMLKFFKGTQIEISERHLEERAWSLGDNCGLKTFVNYQQRGDSEETTGWRTEWEEGSYRTERFVKDARLFPRLWFGFGYLPISDFKKKLKRSLKFYSFFFYFQVDFVYIVWGGRLKCNRVQRSHDIPPPPRTHDLPHCHYPQQNGMFVTISELH